MKLGPDDEQLVPAWQSLVPVFSYFQGRNVGLFKQKRVTEIPQLRKTCVGSFSSSLDFLIYLYVSFAN